MCTVQNLRVGLDRESFQFTLSAQILQSSYGADLSLDDSLAEFLSACPEGPFLSWPDLCPALRLLGVAASHPPELVLQRGSQSNSVSPRDG